jgi:hypothetical protein
MLHQSLADAALAHQRLVTGCGAARDERRLPPERGVFLADKEQRCAVDILDKSWNIARERQSGECPRELLSAPHESLLGMVVELGPALRDAAQHATDELAMRGARDAL